MKGVYAQYHHGEIVTICTYIQFGQNGRSPRLARRRVLMRCWLVTTCIPWISIIGIKLRKSAAMVYLRAADMPVASAVSAHGRGAPVLL
ncbi:hypothetical protein BH20CHL3_BH20CHL3_08030 [soil metagenome]